MPADSSHRQNGHEPTGLIALLYVSISTMEPEYSDPETASIVNLAAETNSELHITGALIFTGARFAQILEGSPGDVDGLMVKILADPRHRAVTIIERVPIPVRRFARWSLAYKGGATYVDRPIDRLLTGITKRARLEAVHEIHAMMEEFTRP